MNKTGMNTTKTMGMTGLQSYIGEDKDSEEENAKEEARKIGPFSFDIDDDIDTEVLDNEQVYDDLKELEDILDEQQSQNPPVNL